MYLLFMFLPLIGAFSSLFFGNKLGKVGVILITTLLSIFNFCISCFIFYEIAFCQSVCFFLFSLWFDTGFCIASWGGFFDSFTAVMLLMISFISMLVHIYSIDYMGEDPHIIRFMAYLSLFTFFMIILVTGDNLLQLFVGWEGVGLCSYLLINFWHTRLQANKAAIKAMLVNRVGDIGLVLGILCIIFIFKSINFSLIFAVCPLFLNYDINILGVIFKGLDLLSFFLFFGAMGKSAQIGLHVWLPDAMEGPTPVSALIHAATMVTAGVFLIVRFSPVYEFCPSILVIIVIVGSITAIFGATTALFQNDLKKVIAYSTCSQLGYMFMICGLSHYSVGVFHLFNHAFFKALLFLGAGSIIHSMGDEQDFRRMGGLRKILPFSYAVMLIGSLSLMGFPFLTGFYSKDVILELAFSTYSIIGFFAYFFGVLTAVVTSIYSTRLLYLVFLGPTNAYKSNMIRVHENSFFIYMPLFLLALGSIFIGFLFKDMFIGFGTPFWGNAIFVLPNNYLLVESEFLPISVKIFPTILVFFSCFLSYIFLHYFSLFLFKLKVRYRLVYIYFNKKWFFDKIINELFIQNFLNIFLNTFYISLDKGIFEVLGPKGVSVKINELSTIFSQIQNGSITRYLFILLFGLIITVSISFNLNLIIFLFVLLLIFCV